MAADSRTSGNGTADNVQIDELHQSSEVTDQGTAVPAGTHAKRPGKRSAAGIIISGIAAVLVIGLVLTIGAFAYMVLMPPVWSEPLEYKNSTGQYQSIVVYRNATDVPYADVSSFVAAEKTALEAAIAADTKERPVEYAVYLHDRAEEEGINCSLIPTELVNEYPGQVLVAFRTTDNGMYYVDPTARNVSAADYPGIPYGNVTLLRDTWVMDAGFLDGNNHEVQVTVHRDVAPVSYDALVRFLDGDDTEEATYLEPTYTCANFAASLFNRSQAQGIKCGLVTVAFEGQSVGHAFNAFPTTDKGIVLIDDTGLSLSQQNSTLAKFQADAVVFAAEGKLLGELNLTMVDGHLDYAFYEEKMKIVREFYRQFNQYEADVTLHNAAVDRYDQDVAGYRAALNDFNAKMSRHNAAVQQFNIDEEQMYSRYLDHEITYAEYTSWYDTTRASVPPAPANAAQLDAWKDRLDAERIRLNDEMRSLNQRLDAIWNSEGRQWAVYSYWQPPEGAVREIRYIW